MKQLHSAAAALAAVVALAGAPARADEGGVSFWLPGQFGSLAAVPTHPGWSLGTVYFHSSASAGGSKEFQNGARIVAGLQAQGDLLFLAPSYVFETPVLGGQAALTVIGAVGHVAVDIDATLSGPGGGTIGGGRRDTRTGVGDLYPLGTLKWNDGMHNLMAYTMAGIPVGSYSAERLANIGTGHWSIDAGGGYTYFDKTNEFSAVLGATYNFENGDTNYRNGVDGHLDWGASRFVNPQTQLGLVGYFYHQLTGDSGSGARLGDFKARASAIGPQLGHFFKVGEATWYANLKGYYEVAATNRPQGWNVWLTLSMPLGSAPK